MFEFFLQIFIKNTQKIKNLNDLIFLLENAFKENIAGAPYNNREYEDLKGSLREYKNEKIKLSDNETITVFTTIFKEEMEAMNSFKPNPQEVEEKIEDIVDTEAEEEEEEETEEGKIKKKAKLSTENSDSIEIEKLIEQNDACVKKSQSMKSQIEELLKDKNVTNNPALKDKINQLMKDGGEMEKQLEQNNGIFQETKKKIKNNKDTLSTAEETIKEIKEQLSKKEKDENLISKNPKIPLIMSIMPSLLVGIIGTKTVDTLSNKKTAQSHDISKQSQEMSFRKQPQDIRIIV